MSLTRDLRTLTQLALPTRGNSHAERLNHFYCGQASNYDSFRKRMLHGRAEMMRSIEIPEGGRWIDFGGGTGANFEAIGDEISRLHSVEIVDLCLPLLKIAESRIRSQGWTNVTTRRDDVTSYRPDQPVDVVTFSYSLTMIPNWFDAIENAVQVLKPGGQIGIVDFYVSKKHPAEGRRRHNLATRTFWPAWFQSDNVFVSADHLPYLSSKFETQSIVETAGKLPFVPLLKIPHYRFVGRNSRIPDCFERDGGQFGSD